MIYLHTHGHVVLESVMGTDLDIVNAARVSFNHESKLHHPGCIETDVIDGAIPCECIDGTLLSNKDMGLIKFLMRERHGTPFEMVELKFDVKAPIFVFREWHRHRTASINEMSGRYTQLLPEFYIPARDDIREQVGKAGAYSFERIEDDSKAETVQEMIRISSHNAFGLYESMLEEGIAKEQARLVLPVNIYSRMKWKVNLRNLMGFLNLRNHPQAMKEIRDYSEVMERLAMEAFPVSMSAFVEHGRIKP